MRTDVISDEQWSIIEPLLPSSYGNRGRPFRDHRQVVEGIVYRYRTGVAWRDMPAEFGPWQTVWKRHRRFAGDGTWDKVLAHLLARADEIGAIDWTVSVDSTVCRAHQHGTNLRRGTGDLSNYTNLLDEPVDHAVGRSRGIEAVIAEPDDQKRNRLRRGSRGGRPVDFDVDKYKGRNVVERSFAVVKQWRGLATRYDKLALTYRAGALLSAVCTWLSRRGSGDMP